jgi:hypothetical protein
MICNESTTGSTPVRATSARLPWLAAAALAAAFPLAEGCVTQGAADPAGQDGPTGELVLSLTQSGPHGEIYQLTNATFDITLVDTGAVTTLDGNGPTLSVSLPPGRISVRLHDGWILEKSVDNGATFQPVSALLGSLNPSGARILANQPEFLRFDFLIRQTSGSLQISFGVVTDPRELAGGFVVQSATSSLAGYAVPPNTQLDFGVFFQLTSVESAELADGTKQVTYTAFSNGGSFGPIPQQPGAVAAEFYNDHIGTLAGPIAADMTGAFLTYTVAARPDGTIQLSGQLIGATSNLQFGPNAIDVILPSLDASGFPNDVFFYDSTAPFTLTTDSFGSASGLLRVRNIVPPPAP